MNCTIGEKGLRCSFLESQESVDVFFHPVEGPQRRVASCLQYEGRSTCHNELGFSISLEDPQQVLVKLPGTLKRNGSFYCQGADGSSIPCQWNAEDKINSDYSIKGPPKAQDGWGIPVIIYIVVAVVFIVVLGIVTWMYKTKKISKFSHSLRRRPKQTEREPLNNTDQLDSKDSNLLTTVPYAFFLTDKTTTILWQVGKGWLQQGKHVYIVSTSKASDAICSTLREELKRISSTQLELLSYDFTGENLQNVIDDLLQKANGNPLYVLAYEAGIVTFRSKSSLLTFYQKMISGVTEVHLWAAYSLAGTKPKQPTVGDAIIETEMIGSPTVKAAETSTECEPLNTADQPMSLTKDTFPAKTKLDTKDSKLLTNLPSAFFLTKETTILLQMGKAWLQQGKHVYIVSPSKASDAICSMLREELRSISSTQLELLSYDFTDGRAMKKAVNDLSQKAKANPLYVLAYEADKDDPNSVSFLRLFYDKMVRGVTDVHLWAASACVSRAPERSASCHDPLIRQKRC